jgi:hypothetical protein
MRSSLQKSFNVCFRKYGDPNPGLPLRAAAAAAAAATATATIIKARKVFRMGCRVVQRPHSLVAYFFKTHKAVCHAYNCIIGKPGIIVCECNMATIKRRMGAVGFIRFGHLNDSYMDAICFLTRLVWKNRPARANIRVAVHSYRHLDI